MKTWSFIIGGIALALVIGASMFYWQNLRGVGPAIRPPAGDISEQLKETTVPGIAGPLHLPDNFSITVLADNVPGARALVKDSFGNWWVSQTGQGTISQLEMDRDSGTVRAVHPVFRNLRRPHGLALHPDFPTMLYFAEEHRIARVPLYSDGTIETILELPAGGGHSTRTLGFGPDKRLYVSIGSSCNVCVEKNTQRATIVSLRPDGSDVQTVATGLRNAVFFTWHPTTGKLWATDNSRDLLGDNIPPDEINIVEAGKDYGWPYCYGRKLLDATFDASPAAATRCEQSVEPAVEIQAHSAPLGLTFVPADGWPPGWAGDLIVAYHGSWNRSEPTGYKLVRVDLDKQGRHVQTEDFITGWLTPEGEALGRPVGVYAEPFDPAQDKPGGVLYVTDDKAGLIYKVQYARQ